MTAARRVSSGCFGRKPAVTMRGLAAMSAPRCTGAAMSRALLKTIPDWPLPHRRFQRLVALAGSCGRALAVCG